MKKQILFFAAIFTASFCSAQIPNKQQIADITTASMTAGDTVGVFAYVDNKPELMDAIKYSGMKINPLGAALTGGIAKTKTKMEYAGVTSPYIFTGSAHFLFRFGLVPASKATKLYMFSSDNSLRDFSVSKFIVKKNKRQLIQGSYSLFGGSKSGTETDESVKITSKQLKDGIYDVIVTAEPGEYCFVCNNNGAGGLTSVFDFTIK